MDLLQLHNRPAGCADSGQEPDAVDLHHRIGRRVRTQREIRMLRAAGRETMNYSSYTFECFRLKEGYLILTFYL